MDFVKQIYNAIKSKGSNESCAKRLGIPLEQYIAIKRNILEKIGRVSPVVDDLITTYLVRTISGKEHTEEEFEQALGEALDLGQEDSKTEPGRMSIENRVDKNRLNVKVELSYNPRNPAEIIKACQVDPKEYRLSTYWNKEQPNGTWLISAQFTQIKTEERTESSFLEFLSGFKPPRYEPIAPEHIFSKGAGKDPVCAVLSLQDMHFGKPGNENMDILMHNAISDLCTRIYHSYNLDRIVFIVGGDTLNVDTFDGTTTKGTIVENSELATQAYIKAFNAFYKAIGIMRQFCDDIHVLYIPGNHDRLSSFHLAHAISKCFESDPCITFDVEYRERRVHVYGDNMLAFEHGDANKKYNPIVFATEFPKQWGQTSHRTLYQGHIHKKRVSELIVEDENSGFVTKVLPSLSSGDYYHYHNKWTMNSRAALAEVHHPVKGLLGSFNHIV